MLMMLWMRFMIASKASLFHPHLNQKTKNKKSMNNFEKKQELSKIGFDIYPGCRNSIVEQAIDEYGISFDEIIGKLDDSTVIDAIYRCCEVLGISSTDDKEEDEEEEEWTCRSCKEVEGACMCEERIWFINKTLE